MNDTASDYLKTYAWIAAMLIAAIAAVTLSMVNTAASREVGDQWDTMRSSNVQHGTLTMKHGRQTYSGHVTMTITPRAAKRKPVKPRQAKPPAAHNVFTAYAALPKGNVTLAGVVPELATFARQIITDCGSRVISAVRNTYIAGTRTKSLHASGRAVDMAGNPSCIARHLASWRGGASTDYGRVAHYHISLGGYEHGRRFAHYGGRKARKVRYARAG